LRDTVAEQAVANIDDALFRDDGFGNAMGNPSTVSEPPLPVAVDEFTMQSAAGAHFHQRDVDSRSELQRA
jgi:hypothetical protein